ncbi:MAG: YlxR family protein [Lachnospiraceae bacterium]|nr:YlxR family protein [Lachnospiraceae bacterium]
MAKKIPMRQCISCRQEKPKSELIRVIRTPEGNVCLDKTGKQNGRGAYLCGSMDCYNKAVKSKAIERTLKVSISEEVYEQIGREMQ